tara:strand:- start:2220 stop:2870 length:651 start_codon:yes stop_codon:yes gene_type:complete
MNINIEIPTKLSDITLGQYKRFLNIQKQTEESHFLNAKAIEIFCDIELKNVMRLKMSDFDKITNKINLLFEQKPKLVQRFKIDSVEYGFHPQLDELTLGEYIDVDTYIADWENMEKTMNVLYRPIENKLKDRYSIKEYNVDTSDNLLAMPMDAVLSSIFFLWNLGIDLSKTILNYSELGVETNLMHQQILAENGDGISQYTHSLMGILQDLKISPN